ncbi:MAG: hypothetical protein NE327_06280 [Lentisphaeraceae bacterium]|nr:hypothetical protein [Lentisphaeraceae bacterium]
MLKSKLIRITTQEKKLRDLGLDKDEITKLKGQTVMAYVRRIVVKEGKINLAQFAGFTLLGDCFKYSRAKQPSLRFYNA